MKIYALGLGHTANWPYGVDFVPENHAEPISFWEGVGHGAAGGFFSASVALEPQWRAHLETAGVLWFVPFIECLARGEDVNLSEVLETYKSIHGHDAVTTVFHQVSENPV
jgi:hypothetical protein